MSDALQRAGLEQPAAERDHGGGVALVPGGAQGAR